MRNQVVLGYSAAAVLWGLGAAQTSVDCNPLKSVCDPIHALGSTIDINFTTRNDIAPFNETTGTKIDSGSSEGALLVINGSKDAPRMYLSDYIFFGRVDVILRAAAGTGIVTSLVLQSDILDEIDLEWVGADNAQVQTNYFRKGDTTTFDRGAYHPVDSPTDQYHNYTIDWTKDRIQWLVNGNLIRQLAYDDSTNGEKYPQTPMKLSITTWVAGRVDAPEGTVEWAGGFADFSKAPFTTYVKRTRVVDYAGGVQNATQYVYGDDSAKWESIQVKTGERKPDLIDDGNNNSGGNETSGGNDNINGSNNGGDQGTGDGTDTGSGNVSDNGSNNNTSTGNTGRDSPGSTGLGTGAIVGIAIGAAAGCIIVGAACFFLGRRNKGKKQGEENVTEEFTPVGGKNELDGLPREKPDMNEMYSPPQQPAQELDAQWAMPAQHGELDGRPVAAELDGRGRWNV